MLHVQSGGGLLGPVRLGGIDPSLKLLLSSTVEGGEVVVEVSVGWNWWLWGSSTGSGTKGLLRGRSRILPTGLNSVAPVRVAGPSRV